MREFKFRLFHRELKQMFWFDLTWGTKQSLGSGWLSALPIGEELGYGNDDRRQLVDPTECEILQYTELTDKNGNEIYEGDIVRIVYTDWASQTPDENGNYEMTLEEYKVSKSTYGYVAWNYHHTGWILRAKSKYSVEDDGCVMTSIIHGTHGEREVMGNIYQNQDLLTELFRN